MRCRFMTGTYGKWAVRAGILLGVLTLLSSAVAQGGNVAISGTVTDASGAIVAGAEVKVTQKNTSATRAATTNSSGQFNFTALPPSTYTVTVQAQGFKQYVQDVVMLADQIRDMDIRMQVGEATQQVTVEASTVAVNTVSQELSQVIERSRVVNMPLNGRNAADLTLAGARRGNGQCEQFGHVAGRYEAGSRRRGNCGQWRAARSDRLQPGRGQQPRPDEQRTIRFRSLTRSRSSASRPTASTRSMATMPARW